MTRGKMRASLAIVLSLLGCSAVVCSWVWWRGWKLMLAGRIVGLAYPHTGPHGWHG